MAYRVLILKRAQRALAELSGRDYERTRDAIASLSDIPRPAGCIKLTGRNAWRIRIGDYRVIYEIDDQQITVLVVDIGHRRDIYR